MKIIHKIFIISFIIILLIIILAINRIKIIEDKKEETIILRLADIYPDNHPSLVGNKKFADLVEEKTEGRIKILIYDDGILGDEASVIEQIQFGGIDFARVSIYSMGEYCEKLNVLSLPKLVDKKNKMWSILDGNIGESLLFELREDDFTGLAWFYGGARIIYLNENVNENIYDLKNYKIRVEESQYLIDLMSCYDFVPIPMEKSQINKAINSQYIQGGEGSILDYYASKYYEQASSIIYEPVVEIPDILIGGIKTLSQLTKQDQEIIIESAKAAGLFQRNYCRNEEIKIEKELNDFGVSINNYVTENDVKLEDKIESLYKRYDEYKNFIEEIKNYSE